MWPLAIMALWQLYAFSLGSYYHCPNHPAVKSGNIAYVYQGTAEKQHTAEKQLL